jgi:RND family efflux transporter MFP subunit
MTKPKTLALGGIALLIILLIFGRIMRQGRNDALEAVRSTTVAVKGLVAQPEPFARKVEASGILAGDKEATIAAETGGRVIEVRVEVGQHVKKGDPLVRLDDELYRLESERAKVAFDKAKMDLDRAETLYQGTSISESDIEAARLGAKSAEVGYEMALKTFHDATIRAPFAGTVAQKMTEVGQMVERGMAVAQLVDVSSLKLTVPVSETEVRLVTPGASATVYIDAASDTVTGKVFAVGSRATAGARTFPVEIRLPGNERLRSGMFARAIIGSAANQQEMLLPRVAVLPDAGATIVFRAHGGTAEKVPVRLIGNQGDRVAVEGLQRGDTVVTTGNQALSHGMAISLTLDNGSN